MIQARVQFGGDVFIMEVQGNSLIFLDLTSGIMSPIEGLRLNKGGVIKQFPDLENDPEWNKKAIDRFKEHLKAYETERAKILYVLEDLKRHGYTPLFIKEAGRRAEKI